MNRNVVQISQIINFPIVLKLQVGERKGYLQKKKNQNKCFPCFGCQRGKQAFFEASQHGETLEGTEAIVGCTAMEGTWKENALKVGCILFNYCGKEEKEK